MAIKQLSVYAENEKGYLVKVCRVLADAGVDFRSLCVADTDRYGIIRIITRTPELALDKLKNEGYTGNIRNVIAVAVPDEVGGFARVLSLLEENDINVEYTYSMINSSLGKAYVVIRVHSADNDRTEKILTDNNIEVLQENDI